MLLQVSWNEAESPECNHGGSAFVGNVSPQGGYKELDLRPLQCCRIRDMTTIVVDLSHGGTRA